MLYHETTPYCSFLYRSLLYNQVFLSFTLAPSITVTFLSQKIHLSKPITATPTAKMGQGKDWTQKETEAACKAYIKSTKDPRSESGNKRKMFNAQLLEHYNADMSLVREEREDSKQYPTRSSNTVMQRLRK